MSDMSGSPWRPIETVPVGEWVNARVRNLSTGRISIRVQASQLTPRALAVRDGEVAEWAPVGTPLG